ncbi:MAG: hypothetical protein BWZ02_00028 [Lentisphaerae bacterium ADurb.BinA184]|nr:MAG: hypothetical protein BWZ02_00028 [Lentisphaerae bacterium ADurb.BinA184]
MAGVPVKRQDGFTYSDYASWSDDERWELIDGEPRAMAPAPLVRHQAVTSALHAALFAHLRKGPCQVFPAPIDVKLSETNVVQPDLVVVCDPDQITETHIEGAPAMVVEILSPASVCHDRVTKFTLYQRFGVKEYWLVTPHPALVEIFVLENGYFHLANGFRKRDTLTSPAFPRLKLRLDQVFTFPIPPEEEIREVEARPPRKARRA